MNESEIRIQGKWYKALPRHPLVVLIIGTVLSCWLIPGISSRANNKRLQQEKMINEATDILNESLVDEERLNSMQTAFELFYKQSISDPVSRKRDQQELKRYYERTYLEFDQHAWWWHRDLEVQANLLHLPPGSIDKILRLHTGYKKSLSVSAHRIEVLAKRFLAKDYRPDDPSYAETLKHARAGLSKDVIARSGISGELARLFALPVP